MQIPRLFCQQHIKADSDKQTKQKQQKWLAVRHVVPKMRETDRFAAQQASKMIFLYRCAKPGPHLNPAGVWRVRVLHVRGNGGVPFKVSAGFAAQQFMSLLITQTN